MKFVPTVFAPAPINVKSVLPRLCILYSSPVIYCPAVTLRFVLNSVGNVILLPVGSGLRSTISHALLM